MLRAEPGCDHQPHAGSRRQADGEEPSRSGEPTRGRLRPKPREARPKRRRLDFHAISGVAVSQPPSHRGVCADRWGRRFRLPMWLISIPFSSGSHRRQVGQALPPANVARLNPLLIGASAPTFMILVGLFFAGLVSIPFSSGRRRRRWPVPVRSFRQRVSIPFSSGRRHRPAGHGNRGTRYGEVSIPFSSGRRRRPFLLQHLQNQSLGVWYSAPLPRIRTYAFTV